jgi:hypothetical protein
MAKEASRVRRPRRLQLVLSERRRSSAGDDRIRAKGAVSGMPDETLSGPEMSHKRLLKMTDSTFLV